jgi:hypothetical protein
MPHSHGQPVPVRLLETPSPGFAMAPGRGSQVLLSLGLATALML